MAGAPPSTGSPPPTSYLPTGDEPTVRYDAARAHPTAPSSPAAGHGAPPTVGTARRRGAIAAIIGGVCLIVVLAIAVIVLATRGPSEQTASRESVQVLPTPTEAVTTDATATSTSAPPTPPAAHESDDQTSEFAPATSSTPTVPVTTAPPPPSSTAAPTPAYGHIGVTTKVPDGGRAGAQIIQIDAGSPAAAAGMQLGDVIVAVDSDPVNDYDDLIAAMKARRPGDASQITVVRGSSTIHLQVILDASD